MMIRGILHQEDIMLLNIYTSSQGALTYVKQLLTELQGATDKNTIIVGKLNTPLTAIDKSSKQEINKEVSALNNTLDQMDIMTFTEPFTPPHQIIYSSPGHMEYSQGQIIY